MAGSSKSGTGRVTLMLVPEDHRARPRRLQVPPALLRHGPWAAGVLALALLAGVADYVRLRVDAVDVAAMRAKTAEDEVRLVGMAEELKSLEAGLERLREFERKVRTIADLPAALPEVQKPAVGGGEGEEGGQGGGVELEPAAPAPVSSDPGDPPGQARAPDVHGLDAAAVARISGKARRLGDRVAQRATSFTALMEQLESKSHHLASLPSIWPTDGWVTSRFGHRISPFTGRRQFHAGLDIAADFGTAIVSPARGRVSFVGRKGPLGQAVVVDHGYGIQTTYGHAAEIFVKRGQEVERGQRIAAVGSTGRSTGPHLHYAVEVRGRTVDPANYILD